MGEIEIPIILLKNKFNFKRRKARNSLAQARKPWVTVVFKMRSPVGGDTD